MLKMECIQRKVGFTEGGKLIDAALSLQGPASSHYRLLLESQLARERAKEHIAASSFTLHTAPRVPPTAPAKRDTVTHGASVAWRA